ncbi:MAG: hypothetical protein RR350_04525 [Oscillibacter sp.]
MASAARELHYHRGGDLYGNLAYDLDREVLEHDLRHAGEMPRQREVVLDRPKVRSVSKTQVRPRQRVSVLAVLGVLAVIATAVLVLMSYIQLTELSGEMVTLKKDLASLQTENVSLTAQYEQMFNQASVKKAAEAAGMSKPGSGQEYYIDLSSGDNAVVYQKADGNVLSKILTSLNHGVYAVVEYFD